MSKASKKLNSEKSRRIVSYMVFITLVLSMIYSVIHIFLAPSDGGMLAPGEKAKSDYTLMLVQCILGIVVMFLPSMIEKRMKITIPSYMHICYILFLHASIYLGEVRSFYYEVPHWDTILHTFSGFMLGAVGYSIVELLNTQAKIKVNMSQIFVAMFAFSFAVATGVLWEIYEFTVDRIFSLNMQKYALQNGVPLLGAEALMDTMKDLIVDTLGALAFVIVTFVGKKSIGRRKKI